MKLKKKILFKLNRYNNNIIQNVIKLNIMSKKREKLIAISLFKHTIYKHELV